MVYSVQQGYAILYDSVLLQNFILHALVYIMQFAWFLFCFLWVRVCIPLHISNTSCSILWSAHKQTLLQALMSGRVSMVYWGDHQLKASIYIFLPWKNAVKLFSCHAHLISEASNYHCGDKPEQPHQELSHGSTRRAKVGRMRLS